MFGEKTVGMALDNGKEIVQLMRQSSGYVPVSIGLAVFRTVFPAALGKR